MLWTPWKGPSKLRAALQWVMYGSVSDRNGTYTWLSPQRRSNAQQRAHGALERLMSALPSAAAAEKTWKLSAAERVQQLDKLVHASSVLWSAPRLLRQLRRMETDFGVAPTATMFEYTLAAAARENKIREVHRVWKFRLETVPTSVSHREMHLLALIFTRHNQLDVLQRLCGAQDNPAANGPIVEAYIVALITARYSRPAIAQLRNTLHGGGAPDAEVFVRLLEGLFCMRNVRQTKAVWQRLLRGGADAEATVRAGAYVMATLVLGRGPAHADAMRLWLYEHLTLRKALPKDAKLALKVATYEAYMFALYTNRYFAAVREVYFEMRHAELVLSSEGYALLGAALAELGEVSWVHSLPSMMRARVGTPHVDAMVRASLVVGDVRAAERVFERTKALCSEPPSHRSRDVLLRGLIELGKLERAERWFERWSKRDRTRPDAHTFGVLMQALASRAQLSRVLALHERLKSSRRPSTTAVYNAVIRAWALANNPTQARLEYANMIRQHVAPDRDTFKEMLSLYVRGGAFDDVATLLHEMRSRGFAVDAELRAPVFACAAAAQHAGVRSALRAAGDEQEEESAGVRIDLKAQPPPAEKSMSTSKA